MYNKDTFISLVNKFGNFARTKEEGFTGYTICKIEKMYKNESKSFKTKLFKFIEREQALIFCGYPFDRKKLKIYLSFWKMLLDIDEFEDELMKDNEDINLVWKEDFKKSTDKFIVYCTGDVINFIYCNIPPDEDYIVA